VLLEKNEKFFVHFITKDGDEKNGPMALLWHLIESYEVDIFEVSLARITEDFLKYIEHFAVTLDEESEFVVMASKLLFYKSRLLLPNPGFNDDSNDSDTLPIELIDQLLEYKKFQMISETLKEYELQNQQSFTRSSSWDQYEEGLDFFEVDLVRFLKTYKDFLEKIDNQTSLKIEAEEITIEIMMEEIRRIIETSINISLFAIIKDSSFMKVVVTFLAILELIRLRVIRAEQNEEFDDIIINKLTERL